MRLNKLETLLYIQPGAPLPFVLSDEYKLQLLYLYDRLLEDDLLAFPEESSSDNKGVAKITISPYLIYKFGHPNAEVLESHRYYKFGLEAYTVFEVVDSEWLHEIEIMNSIHPFHNKLKFSKYRHYVITFEDSTFECIADNFNIQFMPSISMRRVIHGISLTL